MATISAGPSLITSSSRIKNHKLSAQGEVTQPLPQLAAGQITDSSSNAARFLDALATEMTHRLRYSETGRDLQPAGVRTVAAFVNVYLRVPVC